MTSRTTPVGILVLALVSLIAVGCSAPTNAVFRTVLDPDGTAASSSEADPAEADATPVVSVWWTHPRGYSMVLPPGWAGVAVDRDGTDQIIATVASAMPDLAQRMDGVLSRNKARVSAIAADPGVTEGVAPMLVVLAQPTDGRPKHRIKSDVRERILELPGRSGTLTAHGVVLPTAEGVRFDYAITDPDLGELRVVSYLFRFGGTAYLVSLVAAADQAGAEEEVFEAIINSLRFGV